MKYAIVVGSIVVNIARSKIPLRENWIKIDEGLTVSIGDAYDGTAFYRDGEKVLTETERLRMENADMQAALNLLGVVVDG